MHRRVGDSGIRRGDSAGLQHRVRPAGETEGYRTHNRRVPRQGSVRNQQYQRQVQGGGPEHPRFRGRLCREIGVQDLQEAEVSVLEMRSGQHV
jgi:hypothetical protein